MDALGLLTEKPEIELGLAVLVYAGRGGAVATVHPVVDDPRTREPVLGDARVMTREGLQLLVRHISGQGVGYERDVIPENLLVGEYGIVAWWAPSARRPLFFDTRTAIDQELSGQIALHPPLVFVGKPGHLSVYALKDNRRPTRDTELFRAPYLNLYAMGAMCPGNLPLPQAALASDIPQYEEAFFDSSFTHANTYKGPLVTHPGGHNGLWREMVDPGAAEFPAQYLIPLEQEGQPLTLRRAINL